MRRQPLSLGLSTRGLGSKANVPVWWRWPTPALLAWIACAGLWTTLERLGAPVLPAWIGAVTLGLVFALVAAGRGASHIRVVLMAGGFPAATGLHALSHRHLVDTFQLPAWFWLAPLLALLALYPLRAWRDAPLFPTEAGALDQLPEVIHLPAGARVLDAGCGLGHGLSALRRAWPDARLEGIEWSTPLAWLAALRARPARVRRGDMWAQPWSGIDLLYLYQRPETMSRAMAKARREMPPGSWLVSMEFEVRDARPYARLRTPAGKRVWIYRLPALSARPVLVSGAGTSAVKAADAPHDGMPESRNSPANRSSPEVNKPK